MAYYNVVEIFNSINGEGTLAGQLAVFVRFKGCNLNCSYCDTSWANESDANFTRMSKSEIYSRILDTGIKNITLTGGEPLLQDDIKELIELLCNSALFNVEIETNGSINLKKFAELKNPPSFTMDYKLPSSRMENSMCLENFNILKTKDTIKFVIGSIQDMECAKSVIDRYKLIGKCHIYFSPVFGKIEPSKIVEFMIEHKLNDINLQLQMHKFIWDPNAKGV